MVQHPTTSRPQSLYHLFYQSGRVSRVPSRGLQGAGKNSHQPPDSLRALTRVGHNIDPEGRKLPTPPLPCL